MCKQIFYLVFILAGLSLGGCARLFNPYEEDFACPYTEPGACMSASAAYQQSLQDSESNPSPTSLSNKLLGYTPVPTQTSSLRSPFFPTDAQVQTLTLKPIRQESLADSAEAARTSYKTLTYNRLTGLLKKPGTPIIAPPEVIRVLLLPQVSGDQKSSITLSRFRYVILKPSRWVLSDPFGGKP